MACHRRSSRRLSYLGLAVAIILGAAGLAGQTPAVIVAVANAQLRATPARDGSLVGALPLGTELTLIETRGQGEPWLHVQAADGQEGWLLGSLTRTLAPNRRGEMIEQLIKERLARDGDGFAARVELFDFVARSSKEAGDPETVARYALYRLRSMAGGLQAIPFNQGKQEPFASWLASHASDAVYDGPTRRV